MLDWFGWALVLILTFVAAAIWGAVMGLLVAGWLYP